MHLKTKRKKQTKAKNNYDFCGKCYVPQTSSSATWHTDLSRTICTMRKTIKNLLTFDNPGLKSKPHATVTCGSLNMFKIVNVQTAQQTMIATITQSVPCCLIFSAGFINK
jgi:hypothetical protein